MWVKTVKTQLILQILCLCVFIEIMQILVKYNINNIHENILILNIQVKVWRTN